MRQEGGVRGQGEFRVDKNVEEVEGGCGRVGGAGCGGRETGGGGLEEGETDERLLADGLEGTGEWDEERWHD